MRVTREMYAGETDPFSDLLDILLRTHDPARTDTGGGLLRATVQQVSEQTGSSLHTATMIVRHASHQRLTGLLEREAQGG